MAVVKVFDHDDEDFKRWLEEHPDGYVLNCYATGRMHSARCKSYWSAGPRMTANFSVVDLYRMLRTKGFAEGLTQGLLNRSCMYGVRGSIPTQPAVTYSRAKACSTSERQLFEYAEQHRIDATRCALC